MNRPNDAELIEELQSRFGWELRGVREHVEWERHVWYDAGADTALHNLAESIVGVSRSLEN